MDGTIQSLNKPRASPATACADKLTTRPTTNYSSHFKLQMRGEWGGRDTFYPHKIFKLHPTLDTTDHTLEQMEQWELCCDHGKASLSCSGLIYVVSVQFLNIITLKWLDCVIIRVAERQAKYDHYSCYYFLWSSRTMVVMINEPSQHSGTLYSLTPRLLRLLGRTLTTVNNNKVNCKISNELKPQLQRFLPAKENLKTNNDHTRRNSNSQLNPWIAVIVNFITEFKFPINLCFD